MNNTRKISLFAIIDQLEDLMGILDEVLDEEKEYRDNMPKKLHGREHYERADKACRYIDHAIENIEDAISNIIDAAE